MIPLPATVRGLRTRRLFHGSVHVAQSDILRSRPHNTSVQAGTFDRSALAEKKDGIAEASVKTLQCEQAIE